MLWRIKKNGYLNTKKILILLNKNCTWWNVGTKGWLRVIIREKLGNDSFAFWITW